MLDSGDVLLVGLTGGIGSGKSTVSRMLAERGAVVVDADDLARRAVEPGTPGLQKVAEAFSSESSGYHKYKEAFTVPGLEGDGAQNYFYGPKQKKLFVINWGASPRDMIVIFQALKRLGALHAELIFM